MPEPKLVEAVARAISGAPFPSASSLRKARAAIQAMRDPTEAMQAAFLDAAVNANYPSGQGFEPSWHAAIDAALAAPEEGRDVVSDEEAASLVDRIAELMAENTRLRIAFHDAIRRPLGVTPDSGAEFYDARMADMAETRRRAFPDPVT